MGNSVLRDILKEDHDHFKTLNDDVSSGPLLAVGQITRVKASRGGTTATVLAVATGESGHRLRIVRMTESDWQWGDDADVTLSQMIIDPDNKEEEIIWAENALPITTIKFASSANKQNTTRWIFVQKQTSTTILQPQYLEVPIAHGAPDESNDITTPSCIDPCPVLAISHKETGGNTHVDVALSPGSDQRPRQVIILDECGYWTIWTITGSNKIGSKGYKKALTTCGHISDGVIEQIPQPSSYPAEMHRMLLVGAPRRGKSGSIEELDLSRESAHSRYLLLWNQKKFVVFDLMLVKFLPTIADFTATKRRLDYILDIQPSPCISSHVFILTKGWLFWVDVLASGSDEEQGSSRPRIITAVAHSNTYQEHSRLSVSRCSGGENTSLVLLYSTGERHATVLWFSIQPITKTFTWHSSNTILPDLNSKASVCQIDQLHISSTNLKSQGKILGKGVGSTYKRSGTEFFQGKTLCNDLNVQEFVFSTSLDHTLDIVIPNARIGWSEHAQEIQQRWKQRSWARRIGNAFVIPDSLNLDEMETTVQSQGSMRKRHHKARNNMLGEDNASSLPGKIKIRRFCEALSAILLSADTGAEAIIPLELIEGVRNTIETLSSTESIPLLTWYVPFLPSENDYGTNLRVGEKWQTSSS